MILIKKIKSLFSTFTNIEWSHIRTLLSFFGVKVVNHIMKVMPLLFFCVINIRTKQTLFSLKLLHLHHPFFVLYVGSSYGAALTEMLVKFF